MTSIPHPLRSAALSRPDHPSLELEGDSFTAAELCEVVARQAAAFAGEGVGSGDTVALLGAPSLDWIVDFHAIGWLGAAVAPLSPHGPPDPLARELEPRFVRIHDSGDDRSGLGGHRLEGGPHTVAAPERFWPLDEVRLVVSTSGSAGEPHRVELSTAQVLFNAFGSMTRLGHDPADRWLCCLPLHHVGGLSVVLRCAFYGTTAVVEPRPGPERIAAWLDGGEVSLVSLTPSMLEAVLDVRCAHPFPDALRVILVGGGPSSRALLGRCREIGAPVAVTWGMSEAASQISTRWPGDLSEDAGCGPPLPFARVRGDADGLHVTGPIVGGPLLTADRGELDALGRVHVLGRSDDVIVSGGVNLEPGEIEAALRAHPGIDDALVLGVPDARWGTRPVAMVVTRGIRPADDELRAWCGERLIPYAIPDRFVWSEAIPRGALGKPARARAMELLEEVR